MTLTEFIGALQAIRKEHGDLRCWRGASSYPLPGVLNHRGRPYCKPRPGETPASMESAAAVSIALP